MATDSDGLSRRGIVCWVEAQPDGQLRLVMDDVEHIDTTSPRTWRTKVLFTWRNYDEAPFLQSDLSEQDLADIGLNVVSRLAALAMTARGKRDP